ncbi:hypothetical protein [Parerythrobacter jejuensis]|uniref:Uncharacterized protein n=1 Tax=Parerythrobacter jejuensis TaxID=795812 RepID=A0A845AQD8_9SPHN|nr:hypothetical protein [Parerythrobacter jejuensis]MXP31617.1 hypothetical protein [Parerythrobacter jejuensis]
MTSTSEAKPKWRKFLFSMVIGGVAGFAGAFSVLQMDDAGLFGAISTSSSIALLVAVIYLIMGLSVGFGVISPTYGAKFLNVEDPEELEEMQQTLKGSAIGTLALGVLLIVIVMGGPGGLLSSTTTITASIVLFAIAAWGTRISMQHADELMRAVSSETASMAYYLTFAILGGWALLAHIGNLRAPTMIEILTLFWVLVLFATFWVCGRRGMLMPR